MRARILAGVSAVLLLAPGGAVLAEDDGGMRDDFEAFEEEAREGLWTLMMALQCVIESIPQYEMPEVLENGDIIIRRVHPEEPAPEPESDSKQI